MPKIICILPLILLSVFACHEKTTEPVNNFQASADSIPSTVKITENDSSLRTIHVFVALCDNKYQGIVPVPAGIGNGQDPKSNLYWGAGYGVKSFFINKSKEWQLISSTKNPADHILERLLFKHKSKNVYMLADAYDGQFIRQTTIDFLNAAAGKKETAIGAGSQQLYFNGASDLIAYIGHDGLMDFTLQQKFENTSKRKRESIILACYSKNYFTPHLKLSGTTPLLWTSGLMAPEAYTLHDALHEWVSDHSQQELRIAAAKAYSKYQKCSVKAAQNLLVQGW
jgi:hypothetical protein